MKNTSKTVKSVVRRIDFSETSSNNNAAPEVVKKKNIEVDNKQTKDGKQKVNEIFSDGIEVMVDTREFGEEEGGPLPNELDEGSEIEEGQASSDGEPEPMPLEHVEKQASTSTQGSSAHRGSSRGQGQSDKGRPSMENASMTEDDYRQLLHDPKFRKVFHELYKEEKSADMMISPRKENRSNGKAGNKLVNAQTQYSGKKLKKGATDGMVIKSPSDSTIYSPALKQVAENDQIINRISDFVEAMRVEGDRGRQQQPRRETPSPSYEAALSKTQNAIIDSERHRASVAETPAGKIVDIYDTATSSADDTKVKLSDDDFFHLTCHVEEGLMTKIEAGEYVDLERLLPKEKFFRKNDEQKLEWVFKEGSSYLVPSADKDRKINGIRKWEQAFRVYAMIYCGANPNRAKEVWQYIGDINTAAASYQWDNVASYDYTFRHLMEFNPARSWSTIYNQMWNLCMRDPITRGSKTTNYGQHQNNSSRYPATASSSNQQGISFGGTSHSSSFNSSNNNNAVAKVSKKRSKFDYCWNFNKGVKCGYGNRCRFIERCSHCDLPSHPIIHCAKAPEKEKEMAAAAGKKN